MVKPRETPAADIEQNIRALLLHPGFIRLEGYGSAGGRWLLRWSSMLPPRDETILATGSWTVYAHAVETIYQALRARLVKRKPPGKETRAGIATAGDADDRPARNGVARDREINSRRSASRFG
jgi:hypothetical protein